MSDQREGSSGTRQDAVARLIEAAGPRPEVPRDVALRVRAEVHARWRSEVRARRLRRRSWAAGLAAAATLVAAVAGMRLLRLDETSHRASPAGLPSVATLETIVGTDVAMEEPGSTSWGHVRPGEVLRAGTTIRTGPSSRAGIRLGSHVSLRADTGTRFRLVSAVDVAVEQGSIYVDNPPDRVPGDGVTVRTALGIVHHVGTQFEVRMDSGALRVRVREGTVTLERGRQMDTATAGVELRVREGAAVSRHTIPVSGPDWAWVLPVAAPLEIEGRPLGEFLTRISREHGWRLAYATDAAAGAAHTVLHGSVAGLRIDEALGSVLATCGLTHRIVDGSLVIAEQAKEP